MPSQPRTVSTMGSIYVESASTGRILQFSVHERRALVVVWTKMDDKKQLGQRIMLKIFRNKPELKRLFMFDELMDEESLIVHPKFIRHATNFATFFFTAVQLLFDGNGIKMLQLTHNIGRSHTNFKGVMFDAEYWLHFKTAILCGVQTYYPKSRLQRQFVEEVWNRLVMFLMMEMKSAFLRQTQLRFSCVDLANIDEQLQEATDNDEYFQTVVLRPPLHPRTCPLPRRRQRLDIVEYFDDCVVGVPVSGGSRGLLRRLQDGLRARRHTLTIALPRLFVRLPPHRFSNP